MDQTPADEMVVPNEWHQAEARAASARHARSAWWAFSLGLAVFFFLACLLISAIFSLAFIFTLSAMLFSTRSNATVSSSNNIVNETDENTAADMPPPPPPSHLHLHQAMEPFADPMQLPTELVDKIFAFLTTKELSQCQRVSTTWRAFLKRSNNHIWDYLEFDSHRMPTAAWFRELGKVTKGNGKSLTIRESNMESMDAERWHALYVATPRVSHLDLCLSDFGAVRGLFEQGNVWSCLRSLTLNHTAQDGTHAFGTIYPLLRCNRTSLGDASFTFAYDSDSLNEVEEAAEHWPPLIRLRSLRVHLRMDKHTLINTDVSKMRRCARCTPSLQQLNICGFGLNVRKEGWIDYATQHAEALNLWPHLRVIRTQGVRLIRTYEVASFAGTDEFFDKFFVPLEQLRSFESQSHRFTEVPWSLLADYCSVVHINNWQVGTDRQQMQYPTLERYWVDNEPLADSLIPCLAQSFASGTLSTLGFQVESGDLYEEGDALIDDFLTDITWMAGEPSVKTLGLFDLDLTSFHGSDSGRIHARITAVREFVDSFPNLHTLVLARARGEEVKKLALVAKGVLASGRVSNLYVDDCTGTERDFLVQMAKEKGVVIGFDSKVLWPKFPMDLGATTGGA